MPKGLVGTRTSPLSWSEQFCTICLADRPLQEPGFSVHLASEAHRAAVADWERRHTQDGHHDGHVALGIACRCEGVSEPFGVIRFDWLRMQDRVG